MPPEYPENVIIKDQILEGERLELGDKNIRYYLGPNLRLRLCTLVLRVPSDLLHLTGAWLIDSSVEVKRQLNEVVWYEANLKGCRFTGRFISCDFGHKPNPAIPHRSMGGIENCDFSAAHLHGCRFVGCDASTLKFPRWPYFTILEPYQRSDEFAAITWPRELRASFTIFDMFPKTTAAITYSAADLKKDTGVSEERIRALLEGHADVIW